MGKMPYLPYASGIRRVQQIQFAGLNHTRAAKDGEIYEMHNMSSDEYPILRPRERRKLAEANTDISAIYGHEALLKVQNGKVYYNGTYRGSITSGEKQFASMGHRILIWPDKAVLNVKYEKSGIFETLEELKESITNPKENEAYGIGSAAPYEIYVYAGGDWVSNGKELQMIEQSVSLSKLTFQNGTYQEEDAEANTIYAQGVTWADYFKEGDAVKIEGCTQIDANNKTPIIREIEGSYLRFYENTFTLPEGKTSYDESGELKVGRYAPDLEGICTCDNRVWGYQDDTIYASKLGDPMNWNCFDGLSTDSYFVESGTPGKFTACVSYLGYPTFLKEEQLFKLYGSKPSNYQLQASAAMGTMDGAGESAAIASQILFYLGRTGPMLYTGGLPESIADVFGEIRFTTAAAGSDAQKYYMSTTDENGTSGLYVYDPKINAWHKEDELQIMQFAYTQGKLYALDKEKNLWILNEAPEEKTQEETQVKSWVQFADFMESTMDRKGVSRVQLRIELSPGARVNVLIGYDDRKDYTVVKTFQAQEQKMSFYLPVLPRRCDRYRIRLEGVGMWRLYTMAREYYVGSEKH